MVRWALDKTRQWADLTCYLLTYHARYPCMLNVHNKKGHLGTARHIRFDYLDSQPGPLFNIIQDTDFHLPCGAHMIAHVHPNRSHSIGAARAEHRERSPPPRNWKKCRKMMLFPKALFLATTFPKVAKNSMCLLNFYQNFLKFSQNFQTICVFCPNARKVNTLFV